MASVDSFVWQEPKQERKSAAGVSGSMLPACVAAPACKPVCTLQAQEASIAGY